MVSWAREVLSQIFTAEYRRREGRRTRSRTRIDYEARNRTLREVFKVRNLNIKIDSCSFEYGDPVVLYEFTRVVVVVVHVSSCLTFYCKFSNFLLLPAVLYCCHIHEVPKDERGQFEILNCNIILIVKSGNLKFCNRTGYLTVIFNMKRFLSEVYEHHQWISIKKWQFCS